ncbi:MAG TPA: hypothetical protein VGP07_10370 [Polyangia bacterium]
MAKTSKVGPIGGSSGEVQAADGSAVTTSISDHVIVRSVDTDATLKTWPSSWSGRRPIPR